MANKRDKKSIGKPILSKGGFITGVRISYYGSIATVKDFRNLEIFLEFDIDADGNKTGSDGWYDQNKLIGNKHIFYVDPAREK